MSPRITLLRIHKVYCLYNMIDCTNNTLYTTEKNIREKEKKRKRDTVAVIPII